MVGTDLLNEKHPKPKAATKWLALLHKKESKTNKFLLNGPYFYVRKLKNIQNPNLLLNSFHCYMANYAGGPRSVVNRGTKFWCLPVEVTKFWRPRSGFGAHFL